MIDGLPQFVLTIVLVGMVLGVGILVIDKFSEQVNVGVNASAGGGQAATALNQTRDSLVPIASTWLPLVVVVAVLSIILMLIIRTFGFSSDNQR